MKDKFFIFIILGVILIGIVFFISLRVGEENGGGDVVKISTDNLPTESSAAERRDAETTITDDPFEGPVVVYTNTGFMPQEIYVSPADGGCLLTFINRSAVTLVPRLGPHNADGEDPGFPYDAIPPGQTQLIDPRYRIDEIFFHNHENPGASFLVQLDPLCL